jgi:transposase
MINMLKRHEIQVLRKAGHTQADVAERAEVSESAVRRVEREPTVGEVDEEAARQRRHIGRPSKAEPFRTKVVALVGEKPPLLSVEILRRVRLDGYCGGKSALYALVATLRPKETRAMVRFEGLPGEFCQHDFGEVKVRFLDGTVRTVQFLASRLKYSRWAVVSLVDEQGVETLVRRLLQHYLAMGGVPLLAVFDRPKTVALVWRKDGQVTEWNPTFAGVMLELGVGVELCWPASPQQKGAIENLVGWVKGSFFKQRRFLDEQDLREQLAQWLQETNESRPSRATGVIPAVRLAEERPRLRPLKVSPRELALRIPVFVGPTGMVTHDGHLYSMPAEAIAISGTLYLYQDRLRIVAGRYEATHPRLRTPGARSILPEHRASAVAAVSGKRARRYLKREHLLQLGEAAHAYLTELVHRRPNLWLIDVEQLHDLLLAHGDDALRTAFLEGLQEQRFGAEYVRHYLAATPLLAASGVSP